MQLTTIDTNTKVDVNETIFGYAYNRSLVHQVVVAFMNNARSGNSAQLNRAQVRGGGRKPWNQKGTGRARAGTIRSPLWRSGGVTFAAKPRDYSEKLNKKMYKRAIRSIISELHRQGRLLVVSDFQCPTLKTKDFIKKMADLKVSNALVVLNELTENEYYASRNLYDFEVLDVTSIDPVSLLRYDHVILTEGAVKTLEEQLQ